MRCSTSAVLLIGYTFISTTLSLWFVSLPNTVFAYTNEEVVSTENTNDYVEESSSSDDYDNNIDVEQQLIDSILEQVQKLAENDDNDDSIPEEKKARLKALIQSDDTNIVGPELLKLLRDRIVDEEEVITEEEDAEEEKEYKPMGLQIWDGKLKK